MNNFVVWNHRHTTQTSGTGIWRKKEKKISARRWGVTVLQKSWFCSSRGQAPASGAQGQWAVGHSDQQGQCLYIWDLLHTPAYHRQWLTSSNSTPGLLWPSFPNCRPDGFTVSLEIRLEKRKGKLHADATVPWSAKSNWPHNLAGCLHSFSSWTRKKVTDLTIHLAVFILSLRSEKNDRPHNPFSCVYSLSFRPEN